MGQKGAILYNTEGVMPTRVKELRDWLGTFSKDCTVYLMNDEVWVFEEGDEEPTGTFTVEDNYG